jgi:hypothetical protein
MLVHFQSLIPKLLSAVFGFSLAARYLGRPDNRNGEVDEQRRSRRRGRGATFMVGDPAAADPPKQLRGVEKVWQKPGESKQ